MRRAIVRSAVVAACLALAAACTGEHSISIGPPRSTAPSADDAATAATGLTEADETGPAATEPGTEPARTASTGTREGAGLTYIPEWVMLEPEDWPGGRIRLEQTGLSALQQTQPSACEARTGFPSDGYRSSGRIRSISSDQPESGGVHEVAVRYAPGRAAKAMAEMHRVLATCRSYPDREWPGGATVSYRLEREGFAGDDSLLVLRSFEQAGGGRVETEYFTVVRLGDSLLTTSSNSGEATANLGLALRLATTGARRGACLRSSC